MARPTVGVLALQGDVAEHTAAFERCGAATRGVRFAGDLAGLDALVMPGGESTTISRLLRVFELEGALRDRLEAGLPCLATCAGMILLSRRVEGGRSGQLAYGALDIAVRRNGYGRQNESFEAAVEVDGLDTRFPAVFIRAPVVTEVGNGVEVVSRLDGAPVGVRQGAVTALAFHPELSGDDRVHRSFLARL